MSARKVGIKAGLQKAADRIRATVAEGIKPKREYRWYCRICDGFWQYPIYGDRIMRCPDCHQGVVQRAYIFSRDGAELDGMPF